METDTHSNGQQLVDFAHAEAQRAEPAHLREVVRTLLREPELWRQIVGHYVDGGLAGSVQFDKALAAHKVRTWDKQHHGVLDVFKDLNERTLAQAIDRELKRFYELNAGRIVKALPPPEKVAAQ